METTLAATSEVAGTTAICTSVHSNFAIRSLMSIVVVTHVVVAHVTLVVHHSCASVRHWSRIVLCNGGRSGLAHVSIV